MRYNIKEDFDKLEKARISSYGLMINISSTQNAKDFFVGENGTEKHRTIEVTLENHIDKDGEEITEQCGSASCILITTFDEVTGRTLNYLDVIDSIDQDVYNCLSVFMDKNCEFNEELMFSQICYIDRMIINKKYRHLGLGSILLEYIKYKFANIFTAIALEPLAFELNNEDKELFEKESEQLSCFYEKHGFVKYRVNTWLYHE